MRSEFGDAIRLWLSIRLLSLLVVAAVWVVVAHL
jgi:hypothetical protein